MDDKVEVVRTGYPDLLACTACGAILWDVEKHYYTMHKEKTHLAGLYIGVPIVFCLNTDEHKWHYRENHTKYCPGRIKND